MREHPRAVLSVGGGVVSEKETYDRLLASCFTVWVKANPEEYMARVMAQGDFRAMAENDEAMEDLAPDTRGARTFLPQSGSAPGYFGRIRRAKFSETEKGTAI